jgi:hypothetical protein
MLGTKPYDTFSSDNPVSVQLLSLPSLPSMRFDAFLNCRNKPVLLIAGSVLRLHGGPQIVLLTPLSMLRILSPDTIFVKLCKPPPAAHSKEEEYRRPSMPAGRWTRGYPSFLRMQVATEITRP